MTYPGNPSLAAEIRQRILNTFGQTLELASQGKTHEALLGCDFILRMDTAFEPARVLMSRLGESTGGTAVEVSDLRRSVAGAPAPAAAPAAAPLPPPAAPAPGGPAAAPTGSALAAALQDLLDRRELKRLVQLADENRHEVAGSAELRKLVESAYARLEAEPYLKNFLDSARVALQTGDLAEAGRLLSKARSLDPTHPGLAEIEEARGFYEDPARQIGGRRQGISVEEETPAVAREVDGGIPEQDSEILRGFDLFPDEPTPREPDAFAARGDDRIAELLEEGQAASGRGDYQGAIDSWSRIFLIDIDHQEAARRIEQARRLKAEGERRAEELYHQALAALDAGDDEAARQGLSAVLEAMPGHLAARESLEQLERGVLARAALPASPPPSPLPAAGPTGELVLKEEILVPPPPEKKGRPRRAPSPAPSRASAGKAQPWRRFAAIGGIVFVLVAGVAGFLWLRWDEMFPNSRSESAAQAPDPIARATSLHEQGRTANALRVLRLLPPDHPRYAEAQRLLAQWEPAATGPAAPEEPAGPSPGDLDRREREIELARQAYAQGEYLIAEARFRRASQIAPLSGTAEELAADAREQLEPLTLQMDLFEQGEWAMALRDLWRLHQAEPGNRDVLRLMVDSYYNLAVRELQRGNPTAAVQRFDEALALRPESEALKRQRLFAQTYTQRPQDLLYRIYVRYLPVL